MPNRDGTGPRRQNNATQRGSCRTDNNAFCGRQRRFAKRGGRGNCLRQPCNRHNQNLQELT